MNVNAELLDWCRQQQDSLRRQLQMIEQGNMQTHEKRGPSLVDTTSESASRIRVWLEEIETLLV